MENVKTQFSQFGLITVLLSTGDMPFLGYKEHRNDKKNMRFFGHNKIKFPQIQILSMFKISNIWQQCCLESLAEKIKQVRVGQYWKLNRSCRHCLLKHKAKHYMKLSITIVVNILVTDFILIFNICHNQILKRIPHLNCLNLTTSPPIDKNICVKSSQKIIFRFKLNAGGMNKIR